MIAPGPRPPGLFRGLLQLLDRSSREVISGDLDEEFAARARVEGIRPARRWYRRQVVASIMSRRLGAGLRPFRERGPGERMLDCGRTLWLATRALSREPRVSLAAIVAMGLGIGATGATFAVVYGTFLQGLPFEAAAELVHFERRELGPEGRSSMAVTPHDYVAWREQQRSFEGLGAFVERVGIVSGPGQHADRLVGVAINTVSFRLLRVSPALGRLFNVDEEEPGGPRALLLSDGVWRERFAGDPGIVGREIRLNGEPTRVVGVMPAGFGFPIAEDFWVPLRLDFTRVERGDGRLDVFGRLLPGVSLVAARADLDEIGERLERAYPATNARVRPALATFEDEYLGEDFGRTMYAMLAAAFLVQIVACANVAHLLLARGMLRRDELAVRVALGAGRGRILAQVMAEAAVLAGFAAVLGLALGALGVRAFRAAWDRGVAVALPHGSDSLFWWDIGIDGAVLGFICASSLFCCVVAGLIPAWSLSAEGAAALGRASGASPGRRRLASVLVVSEIALSAGLLVAAGVTTRSVLNTARAGERLGGEDVVTATIALPDARSGISEARYPDDAVRLEFWHQVLDSVRARPEVQLAALGTAMPMMNLPRARVQVQGDLASSQDSEYDVRLAFVTVDYFATLGADLVGGREFSSDDRGAVEPVAIVNRSFSRQLFGNGDATGRIVRLVRGDAAEPWLRVVGVAPDLWVNGRADEAAVYLLLDRSLAADGSSPGRSGLRYLSVGLRASGGAPAAVIALRAAVAAIDADVPVFAVRTLDEVVARSTARYRIYGGFTIAFGLVALSLSMIGLYGLMSYEVGASTREIGIRMALGAGADRVVLGVLRRGLGQVGAGLVCGAVFALWLPTEMTRFLFDVAPRDPLVFVTVLGLLAFVGLAACLAPARRAARIDPIRAIQPG